MLLPSRIEPKVSRIAEDDINSRALLKHMLAEWGYEVVVTKDGNEAWEALQAEDAPMLAILDWMMPGLDGVAVSHGLCPECLEKHYPGLNK